MPVRVLFVNPSPIRGGAEQMLETFALGFDPARITPVIACLSWGDFPEELVSAGVDVRRIDAGRMRQVHRWAATVRALARLAWRHDVVCSWQVKGHYYGTPAARAARRPAMWWDHGIRPVRGEPSALAGGFVPRALRADLVLTSSRIAAARHRNARSIHPGIAIDRFRADGSDRSRVRTELGIAAEARVVGIVGRLQPWKGQHVLLRAAARVPEAHFVIVGDAIGGFSAGYPEYLRTLAGELGIADRVTFAGERRDIPQVLAALDVFVHASTDEPFGIVVVEALAAGVPVIATRGGGVPEIVTDGENGLLLTAGDDEALAASILRLLEDDALAARFRAAGPETARSRFDATRMIREFAAVLETFTRAGAEVPA